MTTRKSSILLGQEAGRITATEARTLGTPAPSQTPRVTFNYLCQRQTQLVSRAGALVGTLDICLVKLGCSVPDDRQASPVASDRPPLMFQLEDEQIALSSVLDRFEQLLVSLNAHIGEV